MKQKFAIIKNIKHKKELKEKPKILDLLPDYFYYLYIEKSKIVFYKELSFKEEKEGYEIYLPILNKDMNRKSKIIEKIYKNIILFLEMKKVIIINPFISEHFISFEKVQPNRFNIFFLMTWIENIIKKDKLSLKSIFIVIVDGENKETDLVLDLIYPYINYLGIYTQRSEYFYHKNETILEDAGLNLQISHIKKNILSCADIVIYTGNNKISPISFKKNAMLIDLSIQKEMGRECLERRKDIKVIEDSNYIHSEKLYQSEFLDLYFYAVNEDYREYVQRDTYDFQICRRIFDDITKDIYVKELLCFGKEVDNYKRVAYNV